MIVPEAYIIDAIKIVLSVGLSGLIALISWVIRRQIRRIDQLEEQIRNNLTRDEYRIGFYNLQEDMRHHAHSLHERINSMDRSR